MPKKLQDITKKAENPQNQQEQIQPGFIEKPGQVEIEKIIEAPAMPEIVPETIVEEKKEAVVPSAAPQPEPQASAKSPTLAKIENILQEDLEDLYFQMPPDRQKEFREVGEKTAFKIEHMVRGVKVHVKKVLELIIRWLKIIPGINRFFLEQEAKIKTEEILKLKEEQKSGEVEKNKI